MGGDCKFTNNLSEKFAWGLRIPGLDHSVRCKYCNTVVKIARGLFALKQHEQSAMHKKNMPSTSSRTPNIAAALYTSCSKETGVLRATIYHCLKIIVESYLRTIELEAKFSVDEFLNDSVKKLSDVEFVGSSAVFDAFCTVLAEFKLNYEQIAYVMTDNCNTMRGERSGAVKKIGDVCLNLVSVPGCSVHLANLIAKDVCTANPSFSKNVKVLN